MGLKRFAAIVAPLLANAWWDEGHALSSTVSRLWLLDNDKKDVVDGIEKYLAMWNPEFPELLGNMHYSSIWADHQKCFRWNHPRCGGMDRLPGVRVLDPWHWTSLPLFPNGYELDPGHIGNHFPLSDVTGSDRMLKMVIRDITFLGQEDDAKFSEFGTSWSVNFHLRLFAHMYTDLHQPCHVLESFTITHRDGCLGGSLWPADQSCEHFKDMENKPADLHNIWDAIIVDGGNSWPNIPVDHLEELARKWLTEYPPTSDEMALNYTDIDDVIEESASYRLSHVFKEFSWWEDDEETIPNEVPIANPYCPSQEYVDEMKLVARKRVVLGGIRLAKLFEDFLKSLPDPDDIMPKWPNGDTSGASVKAPSAAVVALGLLGLAWAA
eukprot:Polyplicarium_translucidae@DN3134_c0_g1_i2.p1